MLLTPLLFIIYETFYSRPRYELSTIRCLITIDRKNVSDIAGHGRVGGIVNDAARAGFAPRVIDSVHRTLRSPARFIILRCTTARCHPN